ncbi:MAG TPA: zf-HC2 domain-containing protein [Actinomycetospora sp.]|uniref:zf-HC2 domain-containing protein n=1 Tax=Actinomycetospora sp. TaxID=1872135 RepID=UPI002F3EA7E6
MIGRPHGTPWSRWVGAVSEALPGGHLSLDAVVAHVDGELPAGPAGRAAAHVDRCPACAGEVMAQRQARRRLRGADTPGVPDSLLCSLRAIPDCAELPEAPAGLTLDAEGNFVVPSGAPGTAEAAGRRRARRAAGAPRPRRLPVVVASGLVAGAAAVVGPVVAAGAIPAAVTPGGPAPVAGASLTAGVPVPPAGDRGNPVAGSVEHAGPAGAIPAVAKPPARPAPGTTTPTSPPA